MSILSKLKITQTIRIMRSQSISKIASLPKFSRHQFLFLGISLALSGLIIGCTDSKTSQCQKITTITQEINQETARNLQVKDLEQVLKVADAFDQAAKEMEALTLEDKQLIEYKTGFAKVYQNYAQETRNFVSAFEQKNLLVIQEIQKKLEYTGSQSKRLVNDINRYCQEK
jgi:hypothetical protein